MEKNIDNVIIGFNAVDIDKAAQRLAAFGQDSEVFKDLSLALAKVDGKYYTCLDLMNLVNRKNGTGRYDQLENCDFLWPVIPILAKQLDQNGLSFDYIKLFHREKEKLARLISENKVLSVSITTTIYVTMDPIVEIVRFIRSLDKNIKIILGGPFISNMLKTASEADANGVCFATGGDIFIYDPEGERTLVNVVKELKEGGANLAQLKNIIYKENGKFLRTEAEPENNTLQASSANYGLFNPTEVGEFAAVRTAKSCPFSCAFCNFPEHSGKYVYEGVEDVEQMLDHLQSHQKITTLTFLDDTFNVPLKRFQQILELLKKDKYNFKWNSFFRSDYGDEATIRAMADSGCEGVFLGAESGSDTILQLMNKRSRRHNYTKAIELFREYGITTYASLIIGFPGENADTIAETVDFINTARPDYYRAQLFFLDSKTRVYRERDKHGLTGRGFVWSHNTMDSKTACQTIERMFREIDGSTWLPQQGFELWSLFYLQRHGYSRDQINTIVREFNKLVGLTLENGGVSMEELGGLETAVLGA